MSLSPESSQHAIEIAMRLAVHFHAGQRDKAGECYLLHLVRVMVGCTSPEAKQAAMLHDVLEDTAATPGDLVHAGLGREVVDAVLLLTKPDPMRYSEYILRLAENPIAKEVKLADLQDNYRLDRVAYRPEHTQEDSQRIQRYILTYRFLKGELARQEYLQQIHACDGQ